MFGFLKKWLGGGAPAPLSPAEAQALAGTGALILDVRTPAERKTGFIAGSTHLPLADLPGKLGTLPRDRPIICQCASGMRSAQATRLLRAEGLDARNLRGGLHAWQAAGLPVRTKK